MPEYRKGALLLADVVGYTSQSEKLGSSKTEKFNKHFEKIARDLTVTHNGDLIKRIGDAILIFFEEEEQFLDFVLELSEISKKRGLDFNEFSAVLRMVAHYGKFSFEFFDQKINDLIGPEGIKVFRLEKYANANDILITETLYDFLKDYIIEKKIKTIILGKEKLKGFNKETTIYKLTFQDKRTKEESNYLFIKMEELKKNTNEIPVFGDIYPAMSMEGNFINLDVKKESREEKIYYDFETDLTGLVGVDMKRRREIFYQKKSDEGFYYIDVKKLYDTHMKGIILGLPGSGKTTILKYFAYQEFKDQVKGNKKQKVVLFIECRNIMGYKYWYGERFSNRKESAIRLNIESILNYLTHCFLFKKREVYKDNKNIKKEERLVLSAYKKGRLSILIDALDESPDKEVKDEIIDLIKILFIDCKEGKRSRNRIYLTSRYSERERYFFTKDTDALQPVFEVRSLDMEQLRKMAEYFYVGKPKLYKAFDLIVWKEELAAKVGGTPLTALLVIAYFEIFKKFDTRYHMYNIIVIFILARVWKQIKDKNFKKDMKTFFREAKSKKVLKEEKNSKQIYDALTFLSYEHIDKGRIINEEDIIGVFEFFTRCNSIDEEIEVVAENWLEHLCIKQ